MSEADDPATEPPQGDTEPKQYKCKHCSAPFTRSIELAHHVRYEHPAPKKETKGRQVSVTRNQRATWDARDTVLG